MNYRHEWETGRVAADKTKIQARLIATERLSVFAILQCLHSSINKVKSTLIEESFLVYGQCIPCFQVSMQYFPETKTLTL